MPGGIPPEVAAAMPQGAKKGCPRCNEIPAAGALVCEACGEVLPPPRLATPGAGPGGFTASGTGDEPAVWHLRAGCHFLDSLISIPLSLIPFGGFLYMLFRDTLNNGQSFGKKAGDLRTVDATTGAPCTVGQSVLRNLVMIIPLFPLIELFVMISTGSRLGDRFANTKVVRPRNLGPQPRWGLWVSILGVLLFIGIFVIGILAAIAIPNFTAARERANTRACFANQKVLAGATEMHMLDKNKKREEIGSLSQEFMQELKGGGYMQSIPQDPGQGPDSADHYKFSDGGNGITCTVHGPVAGAR